MTTDVLNATMSSDTVERIDKLSAICAPLMQRSRKDGRFRYPAKYGDGSAEERQRNAVQTLISGARDIAENPGPIMMTRREFETLRAKLQTAADALYALTSPLDTHRTGIDPFSLFEAIGQIESQIARLNHTVVVVERDRGELTEQAVCIHIAQLCHELFGSVMLGVVAALAGAVLGTQIERHSVRNWWTAFIAEQ
jgi:hypothetical protein